MYKEHKYFKLPDKGAENTIWRYMDYWKFKDIIENSTLFMSTIKNMGDRYEGRIPDVIRNRWVDNLITRGFESAAKTVEQMGDYEPILDYNISSWNINKNESYALWKIYTKDSCAIAIKSDISKLIAGIEKDPYWQHIGMINYFDHPSNFNFDSNIMNIALNKFDYYRFENELRILNIIPAIEKEKNPELKKSGDIRINLDLDKLIDSIYLAPNARKEDFVKVEKLLNDNNLRKDIFVSGINDKWSNE